MQVSSVMCMLFYFAAASPISAEVEFIATSQSCAVYRQGPTVADRIAIYSTTPSNDPSTFKWLDVQYRPEYLFRPLIGLGGSDLPKSELLFEFNIEDGQPLPIDGRGNIQPTIATDFTLLLSGQPNLALERSIWILSGSPKTASFELTGEDFYGYEGVKVKNRMLSDGRRPIEEIYIAQDSVGKLEGVLSCDRVDAARNPGCQLDERSQYFQLSVSGFRRNQMYLIEKIKYHARAFTACLAFEGN